MKKFDQFVSNKKKMKASIPLIQESRNETQLYLQTIGFITQFHLGFDLAWAMLKKLMKTAEMNPEAWSSLPSRILYAACLTYPFMYEKIWIQMLEDRKIFTDDFSADDLNEAVIQIETEYLPEFDRLEAGVLAQYNEILDSVL